MASSESSDRGTYTLKIVHSLMMYEETTFTETLTVLTVTDTCVDENAFVITPLPEAPTGTFEFILQTDDPFIMTFPTYSNTVSDEQENPYYCGETIVETFVEVNGARSKVVPPFI